MQTGVSRSILNGKRNLELLRRSDTDDWHKAHLARTEGRSRNLSKRPFCPPELPGCEEVLRGRGIGPPPLVEAWPDFLSCRHATRPPRQKSTNLHRSIFAEALSALDSISLSSTTESERQHVAPAIWE